jgi:hypothetical protein
VTDDDPITRAQHYREVAADCRRLAKSAPKELRDEYEFLASRYDQIAEAEITLFNAQNAKKGN